MSKTSEKQRKLLQILQVSIKYFVFDTIEHAMTDSNCVIKIVERVIAMIVQFLQILSKAEEDALINL